MTDMQKVLPKLQQLIEQGKTYKEIGDRFGVKKNTVWRWVQKFNLDAPRKYRVTQTDIQQADIEIRSFNRRGITKSEWDNLDQDTQWVISRLYANAKSRAKKKGISFFIDYSHLLDVPKTCPILGIPLIPRGTQGCDTNYSLDRIDNDKGYVPENIHIISFKANRIKSHATFEEIKKLYFYMEQNQ